MKKYYDRVCAKINLDNALYNMQQIASLLPDDVKMYAITKADAYGHGAVALAREYEKLDYIRGYAVATDEEALQMVAAGIKKDILVLGYTFPSSYEDMINNEIRLTVFRMDTLEQLSECAKQLGKKAFVHIKVDTGMGRIGIQPYDFGMQLIECAINDPYIELEGIFTHFASADERDKTYALEQMELFKSFTEGIEDTFDYKFKVKHMANSAAIIDIKDSYMDAVRVGIIQYGMWPSDDVSRDKIDIKPVMSLHSHITYIKTLAPNSRVSYGGIYTTTKFTRVATVPIGYADGYPRSLSNKADVIIKGQRAPIIGRICMDQFMVDVTQIFDVNEGDEVVLIGSEGNEIITMEELGDISGHFNYELACNIGKRVPRLYIKDGIAISSKDYFEDVPVVDLD